MASFNKVILIGNLTADPELKTTQNGVSVTSFSIGVQRRYTSKGNDGSNQQTSDFINIVCWRSTAEFVTKYFTKGKSILVCGSLQTRSWTDANGVKRYATEVVADEVSFVDKKGDSNPAAAAFATPAPYSANPKDVPFEVMSDDDDLPF
ncbi:MAG TPA: single-stranded DNA-binding protein [Clostridiales bacterium]|jgi:single-strand DNA-binding protein|nr:single-stranded DNA-binding protein [Clostridiales bacterium]HBE12903.1 single-stranded DNA-binding protein [Clostridiales bacterium]HCG36037.1 single-stranded DNA-binding protein [Clostridiales bacterium]